MTVSRSGKRGKPKMRPAARNSRVAHNARRKATTRPGLGIQTRDLTVCIGKSQDQAADMRPANEQDNISAYALQHNRYEAHHTIFRTDLETSYDPRIVNKTVTVIDGWIDDDVFHRSHVRVIEYVRELWRDIQRPRHPFFDPYDPEERDDSFESERAKNLLRRCRNLVGSARWSIFENVVRWNEPTGVPGSRIAAVHPSSIIAAQDIVADVAADIRQIL